MTSGGGALGLAAGRRAAFACLSLVVGLGSSVSCSRCGKREQPSRAELTVHLAGEPKHLNPLIQEGAYLGWITNHNLFEGLIRRDPETLALRPALATRWSFSNRGRVLTFTLRRGVKFHDGIPFGAKDVIFTLDRLKDPRVEAGPVRADLTDLVKWERLGPGKVRLTFGRPYFKLLDSLSHLSILPRHVYEGGDLGEHPANLRPVGTGPFRFSRWERGSYLRLVRWKQYWGQKPALRAIVYRFVRSQAKAFALARKGEIDLLPRLLPDQYCGADAPAKTEQMRRRFRVVTYYPVQFYWIFFNHRRPIFRDARVRRALALLVDRQLLAEKLYCGRAKLISGPYWVGGKGYDRSVKPYPTDRARAKKLLAAAGWRDRDGDGVLDKDGQKLRFTYLRVSTSTLQRRLIPIVREQWRKAGIEVEVETLLWKSFLERLKSHRFDVTDLKWLSGSEQDLYQMFHSSQCHGGSNYGCYANPEVDRRLVQIRGSLNPAQRHRLEREVHGLLHRDVAGIFMYNAPFVSLASRRFRGLKPSPEWFPLRDVRPAKGR